MVLINDIKFACQACIKGHRSSGCSHTDRPLFEIRRKGRPATQCDTCRDLRKTRKLHVKCVCDGRRDPDKTVGPVQIQSLSPSVAMNGKKTGRKIPLVPTLPNGLKDTDEPSSHPPFTPSDDSVDRKPDPAEILLVAGQPSLNDQAAPTVIPPASSSKAGPVRSCCARKNKTHTRSLSLVGPFADLDVSGTTITSTPSGVPEQLTTSTSSLGLSFSSSITYAEPLLEESSNSVSGSNPEKADIMMACLCGTNCHCLNCTLHRQPDSLSLSGIDVEGDADAVMHGVGCPPDCPSCMDCINGAGWPVLSVNPQELSGRPGDLARTVQGSTTIMSLDLSAHNLEPSFSLSASDWYLTMDSLEEYDNDMDAEGSPDPDYCPLPSASAFPETSKPQSRLPGHSTSTISLPYSSKVYTSTDSSRTKNPKGTKDCCTNKASGSRSRACCAGRASRVTTNQNVPSKLRL